MIPLIAVLLLAVPLAVHAQSDDPLSSGECTAARTCLGPASGQPQRSGAPQPAQVVPPPVIATPSAPATLPPPAPPLPRLAIPRPATVTTCDPAGCWDSEGRRLNQVGPLLMGPHGLCSIHGGAVTCL